MLTNPDLDEARRLYGRAGLPFPPIPAELVNDIRQIENWVYGTRGDQSDLYYLDTFVDEALESKTQNYLLFGHSGRGTNSWAIHYYLVREALALFIQVGWGGGLTEAEDNARAAEQLQQLYQQAADLMSLLEGIKMQTDERYILQLSGFYGAQWTHQRPNAPAVWQEASLSQLIPTVIGQLAQA